ncbi:unnamed protein product, partial [Oppiella nova]
MSSATRHALLSDGFGHQLVHDLVTTCWTPANIFISVLIFTWIYKIYKSVTEVPTELIGVLDTETLIKARDYNIDKSCFGFYAFIWNQLLNTAILWTEAIPLLWRYSGRLIGRVGYTAGDHEILQTLAFVLIGSLISHSNAYFYGFHKNKRIVLFDTLIEDFHKKEEEKS